MNPRYRTAPLPRGIALLTSLVLLTVITILVLAGHRAVHSELLVAGSLEERQRAFELAEAGLHAGQAELLTRLTDTSPGWSASDCTPMPAFGTPVSVPALDGDYRFALCRRDPDPAIADRYFEIRARGETRGRKLVAVHRRGVHDPDDGTPVTTYWYRETP